MSDWIDLQLAHSLTPVSAPDELWARIQAPVARQRRPVAIRWAVPAAIAACVMVLLARPVREDRTFASSDPAAVAKRMAHKAGVSVPAEMRLKSAQILRSGDVRVSYEVDGKSGSVLIERGAGHTDSAACRLCHSL